MIVSGLWLLVFIVIHVKAFRYGIEYEWPAGGRDLYRLEMENFANPLVVGFYVVSMLVVGSHSGTASRARCSRSASTIRDGRRACSSPARSFAVLIAGGFIVIAVWALLCQSRRVRV